jgi:hypothetical protein
VGGSIEGILEILDITYGGGIAGLETSIFPDPWETSVYIQVKV